MSKPFQRVGSESNAHVGHEFELAAQEFFRSRGLALARDVKIPIGIGSTKKDHSFDLGCLSQRVLVECKSHRWTAGGNVPSAKLAVWNEAMYYFYAAPRGYRKIMFVLRDYSSKRSESLAEYYLRTHSHLVPSDIEFWEYDAASQSAKQLKLSSTFPLSNG